MNATSQPAPGPAGGFYAPSLAQVVVSRRCNLACAYCREADRSSALVPASELEERAARLRGLGTRALEYTGGEPLLHPDISRLVAWARRLGFSPVAVKTNGTLLDEAAIEAFNESGLDVLQLSVDTMRPSAATPKAIDCRWRELGLLRDRARFRVTVSAVAGSSTAAELVETLSTVRDLGFTPRVLLRHGPDGQTDLSADERASHATLLERFPALFAEAGDYRRRLLLGQEAPFFCRAGCKYLYLDESGTVRWCAQQMDKFGKPLVHYAESDLASQFHTPKPCSARCTLGCARTASQPYAACRQGPPASPGSQAGKPSPNGSP